MSITRMGLHRYIIYYIHSLFKAGYKNGQAESPDVLRPFLDGNL